MAQNNCLPANIYGEFDQHLFLGCSVASFSSSLGWNGSQSELTVQLAYDPCESKLGTEKIYYDNLLQRQTTTGPDPGFTYPTIGSPCYFRMGNFEYTGLLQSYEEQESEGGHIFVVKLVDPSEILRGTQLILNDYAGSVFGLHNVLNVYGFAESFGTACPLTQINGAYFGSPSGAFGGANANINGMPWPFIKDAVHTLCSGLPRFVGSIFAPYGRLVFRGSSPDDQGYGVIKSNEFNPDYIVSFSGHNGYLNYYLVDLSNVPDTPNYWRLAGPSMSLLDAITEVCDDAGYDFYVELIPAVWAGEVLKIIKIRTAYRRSQPTLGQISQFLDGSAGSNQQSVGVELRNEVTSNLLIGGPVDSVYQALTSDLIEQYWGLDINGDVIQHETIEQGDAEIQGFHVDITHLNSTLYDPIGTNTIFITVDELRAALLGEDSWRSWTKNVNSLITSVDTFGTFISDKVLPVLDLENLDHFNDPGPLLPRDATKLIWPNNLPRDKKEATFADIQAIFNFVNVYATEYYGKKFTVRLPYTCVKREEETLTIITTESPIDSGWTEHVNIIGLPHPSAYTDFFGDEDGKIKAFVGFSNASERQFSEGNDNEDFVVVNNVLYIKAEVDTSGFVYDDAATFFAPKVLLETNNRIILKLGETETNRRLRLLEEMAEWIAILTGDPINGEDIMGKVEKLSGNQVLNYGLENIAFRPVLAALALRSNTQVYGPWYLGGPPGQTKIEVDEGLVPWEYGGLVPMAIAGTYKVEQGVTYMQAGELGNVTIPGLPELPLGAELRFGAPAVIENRSIVTDSSIIDGSKVFTTVDAGGWTGLDGPNITNINCEVGQNGITTSYQMRTYTPKYSRFARQTANRIKAIGQRNLRITKALRIAQFNSFNAIRGIIRRRAVASILGFGKDVKEEGATPGEILVGQVVSANSEYRTGIVLADGQEAINEYTGDYEKKAIASLDTLFRPASKDGSGLLSGYTLPNGVAFTAIRHITRNIEPPIENYTNVEISTRKLDPFKDIPDDKYVTDTNIHHDMEILAYGVTPDDTSHILPVRANIDGDALTYSGNNYRFHVIRGPVLIQGWGFDLDGKPVPNEADTGNGFYAATGLKDKFKANWLAQPHLWPVAPLDLRYDRERGVWTFPSGMRIVRARLDDKIDANSGWNATAKILKEDGRDIEDATGVPVTDKEITVWCPFIDVDGTGHTEDEGKIGTYAQKHDIVVCYYDTSKNRYWGLIHKQASFAISKLSAPMCATASQGSLYQDAFRILPTGTDPNAPTFAYNDLSLAGMEDDLVLLYYDAGRVFVSSGSGQISQPGWCFAQVQHHSVAKLPLRIWNTGTCLRLEYAKGAVMRCEEPQEEDLACWEICETGV